MGRAPNSSDRVGSESNPNGSAPRRARSASDPSGCDPRISVIRICNYPEIADRFGSGKILADFALRKDDPDPTDRVRSAVIRGSIRSVRSPTVDNVSSTRYIVLLALDSEMPEIATGRTRISQLLEGFMVTE